jgi:hypothetical protein
MNVTHPNLVKRVKIEYIDVVQQTWTIDEPFQYIDEYARTEPAHSYKDKTVDCFRFSIPFPIPTNQMCIAICNITELRFTPPTPTQDYWRIGFAHAGSGRVDRANEFITSATSAKALFDEWFSRY